MTSTQPTVLHSDHTKLLLHKFILQLSWPVVGFILLVHILPFTLTPYIIPAAVYFWSFPAFLVFYLAVIAPHGVVKLLSDHHATLESKKNVFYVLGLTAIITFLGMLSVDALFSGVALPIFFSPIILSNVMRVVFVIIAITMSIKVTTVLFLRKQFVGQST